MTVGIYCYIDKKDGSIVYIGKDSNIHKNKRHHDHLKPSSYNAQHINKVLQNNPDRYEYKILKSWDGTKFHESLANVLEMIYIKRYNPLFNFTAGGEGSVGYKHSDENKKKMSQNNGRCWLGKHLSKEHRQKISDFHKGRPTPDEQKVVLSKIRNTSGFFRVIKVKDKSCKNGFIWGYSYYDENNKTVRIQRTDLFKLKQEVEERSLPWKIIDIDKAVQTVRSIHTGF